MNIGLKISLQMHYQQLNWYGTVDHGEFEGRPSFKYHFKEVLGAACIEFTVCLHFLCVVYYL